MIKFFVFSPILTKLGEITVLMSTAISLSLVKIRLKTKRGRRFQNSTEGNKRDSYLCRDFSKKLLKSIFGSPKLHLGQKKLRKKI